MDFAIIQRSKQTGSFIKQPSAAPASLSWETCLRQVFFVPPSELESFPALASDKVYEGFAGYQFLLEVLCGLQSPLIGETEVLGQFKNFLRTNDSHPLIRKEATLWNSLLRDCKQIRDQHLKNLGCHSYGSLCRRILGGDADSSASVSIIGSGHLTQEILPWLKELSSVQVCVRDLDKAQHLMQQRADLQIVELKRPQASWNQSLLVCAPISNEQLMQILSDQVWLKVLDFRGENTLPRAELTHVLNYHSLAEITATMADDRAHMQTKVGHANEMIQQLTHQESRKMIIRPMGWDDLCA